MKALIVFVYIVLSFFVFGSVFVLSGSESFVVNMILNIVVPTWFAVFTVATSEMISEPYRLSKGSQ